MFLIHQIVTLSFHYFVCIQCYRCSGDPNEGNCTDQVRTIECSLDKNLEYQDLFVNTITVRSYKHLTSDQCNEETWCSNNMQWGHEGLPDQPDWRRRR